MNWIISSSWYCTLIVSFTNLNCNSRIMFCNDLFQRTHCNRMFSDLWISNSFASFSNQQGQRRQSSKLSDFEKKFSLLTKQKFPSLLKKCGIQRTILMVDSYHSSNTCTMKTVKNILSDGYTSSCRKL